MSVTKVLSENFLVVFLAGMALGMILFQVYNQLFGNKNRRAKDLATAKALSMRSKPQYTRVRQTDIKERLTRLDKKVFGKAEKLESAKKYREAAELFESVRFQRRAIDILESAGLINEAAQMLVRLKAPNRAGILYERNKYYEKAAHFFKIANLHQLAGKAFLKLATADCRYYSEAATSFARARDHRSTLECYAELLEHDEIYQRALANREHRFLAIYMHDYSNARYIFSKLNEQQIEQLIRSQALTPRTIQIFAAWVCLDQKSTTTAKVIEHICQNSELSVMFWKLVPQNSRQKVFADIKTNLDVSRSASVRAFADALAQSGIDSFMPECARLYFYNKDFLLGAKYFAVGGDLNACRVCLANSDEINLRTIVDQLVTENSQGPWSEEVTSDLSRKISAVIIASAGIEDRRSEQERLEKTRNAVQNIIDSKKVAS